MAKVFKTLDYYYWKDCIRLLKSIGFSDFDFYIICDYNEVGEPIEVYCIRYF